MNTQYIKSLNYMQEINLSTFDSKKISNIMHGFITENSKDINESLIQFAKQNIDREYYIEEINKLINNHQLASDIEFSIYEFALIYTTMNNLDNNLVNGIYEDKFGDIYMNLDTNSRLKNRTFLNFIKQSQLNPRLIAFLSPNQIHPENWEIILDKIRFKENAENNMCTTDIYTCSKCGEKKSKITELQLRGADEPSTRFITCMVCYNTFLL
jgi:DNA-directed RNA polymerase subunit M/transcription elongation factor TFIIS